MANIQNLQTSKADLQAKNKQAHSKVGEGDEQTLLKRRQICGQQTYEKMLIITGHQRMQIKTTMRYHLTTVRMAIIFKETTDAGEAMEKQEHFYTVGESVNEVQPLWKTVWQFLKDPEPEIPFDPAIPLLGIYPKDYKYFYKDTCTCMFIAALFIIAKTMN